LGLISVIFKGGIELEETTDLSSFKDGLSARLKKLEESYANRSEAVRAYGLQKGAYERWVYARSSPSLEAVAKIAKVAGVSLDWLAFGEEGPSAGAAAHTGQQAGLDDKLMFEIWSSIQGIVDSYRMKYPDYQHISLTCQIYESMKADPDRAEETLTKMLALVETSIKGLFEDSSVKETPEAKHRA